MSRPPFDHPPHVAAHRFVVDARYTLRKSLCRVVLAQYVGESVAVADFCRSCTCQQPAEHFALQTVAVRCPRECAACAADEMRLYERREVHAVWNLILQCKFNAKSSHRQTRGLCRCMRQSAKPSFGVRGFDFAGVSFGHHGATHFLRCSLPLRSLLRSGRAGA